MVLIIQSFADLLANIPMKRSSDLERELGIDPSNDVSDDSLLVDGNTSHCFPPLAPYNQGDVHPCTSVSPLHVLQSAAGFQGK